MLLTNAYRLLPDATTSLLVLVDHGAFQHPFVTRTRPGRALIELILRTKAAVRELDNINYRKMKKILMVDGTSGETNGDNGTPAAGNGHNQCALVHDEDSAVSVRLIALLSPFN